MIAALRSDIIQYVIFEGNSALECYPEWYLDEIYESSYVDELGFTILVMEEYEQALVECSDVFLQNRSGSIRKIDLALFEEHYCLINAFEAVPWSSILEYYIYKDENDPEMPKWVRDLIMDGFIFNLYGTSMYYGNDGEVAMSPECGFLKNSRGDIMYLDEAMDTFLDMYRLEDDPF